MLTPRVVAGFFADGSTAGDPAWGAHLRSRRSCLWSEAGAVKKELESDLAQSLSQAEIIGQLQAERAQVRASIADFACRGAEDFALHVAISNVKPPIGSQLPTARIPVAIEVLSKYQSRAVPH